MAIQSTSVLILSFLSLALSVPPSFIHTPIQFSPGLYFEYIGKFKIQVDSFKFQLSINISDLFIDSKTLENQINDLYARCPRIIAEYNLPRTNLILLKLKLASVIALYHETISILKDPIELNIKPEAKDIQLNHLPSNPLHKVIQFSENGLTEQLKLASIMS